MMRSWVGWLMVVGWVMVFIALGMSGCGGDLSRVNGAGGSGGGRPGAPDAADAPADPAACECRLDSEGTLVMSWDCFCAMGTACSSTKCSYGLSYIACGLTVTIADQAVGPNIDVRDSSNRLVGIQLVFDIGLYSCPTDPSIYSRTMRAGVFPDPSCDRRTCNCALGTDTCTPAGDGGTN
jgi:hypothetical protein